MIGMVPVSYGVEAGGAPPALSASGGRYSVVREVGIRLRDTGAVGSCVELNALRCSISNAKSRLASLFRGGRSANAQLVVGGHLSGRDGHDVGIDDPLAVSHPAPFVLKQHGVTGPVCVVPVGVVGAQVIEAPTATVLHGSG